MFKFTIKSKKYGKFEVLIDEEDKKRVLRHTWSISKKPNKNYFRVESRINGKNVKLHRFILDINNPKIYVDHKNFNTLDNRKENLRPCTPDQNSRNCKGNYNPLGYRGVKKVGNRYRAKISYKQKHIHLGYFNTIEEAAKARDQAVLEISGEFAILNFPI